MKTKYIIFTCLICLVVGFFAGRKTISSEPVIKYVKGETIRDTIHVPHLVKETFRDTILLIEHDTVKTLVDWNTERIYSEKLFSDNKGALDISATIQFNRLQNLSYEFTPIYKEVTIYKERVWQPFVGASYNSFNEVGVSIGTFYHDIGIEATYLTDFRQKGWGIGIKYKF